MKSSLGHVPKPRWEFDQDVVDCFEDMLSRSVPDYATMRSAIFDVSAEAVRAARTVVDLGASKGNIAGVVHAINPRCMVYALDNSPVMVESMKKRFAGVENVEVLQNDLRVPYPGSVTEIQPFADVVFAVLVLQFLPFDARRRLLREMAACLNPGGMLVLVEKVLGNTFAIDALLRTVHERRKKWAGYSEEEIEAKKKSLVEVMVPCSARWWERELDAVGEFPERDVFWRSFNFCGWVAIKRREG